MLKSAAEFCAASMLASSSTREACTGKINRKRRIAYCNCSPIHSSDPMKTFMLRTNVKIVTHGFGINHPKLTKPFRFQL